MFHCLTESEKRLLNVDPRSEVALPIALIRTFPQFASMTILIHALQQLPPTRMCEWRNISYRCHKSWDP